MTTRTYYETFRGKVKWAKTKAVNKFGRWSVDVYFDDASLEKFKKLKEAPAIKNELKKDEDGYYATFSRDPQKQIRGKLVIFDPPFVTGKDDGPCNDNVGNGSDCDVVVQVYTWGGTGSTVAPGRAARWHAIKVYNLVPFEVQRDYTELEITNLRGLNEQPPMPHW